MQSESLPPVRHSAPIVPAITALIPSALLALGAHSLGVPAHPAAVALFGFDLLALGTVVFGFGWAITGRPGGIALSSWNDYSLSKLQMVLWTVVVLGAFLAIASLRLLGFFGFAAAADPLAITVPGPLLAAMGIAAFTTTAAPSILALKAAQPAETGQIAAARRRGAADFVHTGQAVGRSSTAGASWIDVVTGDELANAGTVDLSKVQHLLVTLLLLGTYIGLVMRQLAGAAHPLAGLPDPGPTFVELLALSHAGYLVYKAAPKSDRITPAPAAAPAASAGPSPSAAATARATSVPVRLAIDDAAQVAGLVLTVDGRTQPVGPDGYTEVSLDPDRAHRFVADGTRAGQAVHGTLTITPGARDVHAPLALALAPEARS